MAGKRGNKLANIEATIHKKDRCTNGERGTPLGMGRQILGEEAKMYEVDVD